MFSKKYAMNSKPNAAQSSNLVELWNTLSVISDKFSKSQTVKG